MSPNSAQAKQVAMAFSIEEEAQQVLNEMWSEKALPFALHVGKITREPGAYIIHFYDSRIRTARVQLALGQSFEKMVRTSVLARVAKMSGPLAKSTVKASGCIPETT